jgi:hypothetical protein
MSTQTAIMLYKGIFKMNDDQEILEYLKGVLSVEQELALEDNMVVFFTTYDGCYSLDKEHSICGNIWNNLSFEHKIDIQHFKSWKFYSGDEDYPVIGKDVYDETDNFWVGEQLELRLDLVKHLVNCYEKELGGY